MPLDIALILILFIIFPFTRCMMPVVVRELGGVQGASLIFFQQQTESRQK